MLFENGRKYYPNSEKANNPQKTTSLEEGRVFMPEKKQSAANIMAKDLIGGCFGGVGIAVAGHPFDTLKVNILLFCNGINNFLYLFTIADTEP